MKCGLVADLVFAIIIMIVLFIAGHTASKLTCDDDTCAKIIIS